MIKDIEFPKIENVAVAVVNENIGLPDEEWNVYLINQNKSPLTGVLVNSKGYGELKNEPKKTSNMRHFFEEVKPLSFVKVEMLPNELFELTNEFWVSFYLDGKLYDKKYIFLANTINNQNTINLPILNKPGVFHP